MNTVTSMTILKDYTTYLYNEERSENTVVKYIRDIRRFLTFLNDSVLSKEIVLNWKEQLIKTHAPSSVNSMLAAVNGFLEWTGAAEYKVKPLKIQKEIFAKPEKELTREEYNRLVKAAQQNPNKRLALLLQTICATGIRVSELQFITVSAILTGRATVSGKGKIRTIFLASDLCRVLKKYCRTQQIEQGIIFRTSSGKALDRTNIWKEMKQLCERAGVDSKKVFPHNLRHLFAKTYYQIEKDLSRLADLLGHSSINTTRIYTMESGQIHEKQLERMQLVLEGI